MYAQIDCIGRAEICFFAHGQTSKSCSMHSLPGEASPRCGARLGDVDSMCQQRLLSHTLVTTCDV